MFVMLMINRFLFKVTSFCVIICFLTKLPTLTILLLAAVNAEVVAKPLIFGVLFSNSLILAL